MSETVKTNDIEIHAVPDDGAVHAHISPAKFYFQIFAGLVLLTLLTIGVSYVHLGKLNLVVAILISTTKASLVVTFFMHLKYDNRFNALMFLSSLLFIGVFFAYTLNDTDHRGQVDSAQGVVVYSGSGKPAPGGEQPLEHEDDAHETFRRAAGGSETK
jgi:cytochrome c oxidase subunit 4